MDAGEKDVLEPRLEELGAEGSGGDRLEALDGVGQEAGQGWRHRDLLVWD
jgi:hypothetical protein